MLLAATFGMLQELRWKARRTAFERAGERRLRDIALKIAVRRVVLHLPWGAVQGAWLRTAGGWERWGWPWRAIEGSERARCSQQAGSGRRSACGGRSGASLEERSDSERSVEEGTAWKGCFSPWC